MSEDPAAYRPVPTAEPGESAADRVDVEVVRHRAAVLLHTLPEGVETQPNIAAVVARWREAMPPTAPADMSDREVLALALATSEALAAAGLEVRT